MYRVVLCTVAIFFPGAGTRNLPISWKIITCYSIFFLIPTCIIPTERQTGADDLQSLLDR